jgi:hypothetical protein
MATFQDLQNLSLWRLRQRGVNFQAAPGNGPNDVVPPYVINTLLNLGYSEFLTATIEAYIATLKTSFLTVANATAYSLRPMPNTPANVANPAPLRVLEVTYTTATGMEYGVELVDTKRFASLSGNYSRRLSWFGPRVQYAARLYRRPQLEVLPGTATAGDTMSVTFVPDPANSAGVACALGGPMSQAGDVPLIPAEFHQALVEYVVINAGSTLDKAVGVARAQEKWDSYVLKALGEGATEDGGQPMSVGDRWAGVDAL